MHTSNQSNLSTSGPSKEAPGPVSSGPNRTGPDMTRRDFMIKSAGVAGGAIAASLGLAVEPAHAAEPLRVSSFPEVPVFPEVSGSGPKFAYLARPNTDGVFSIKPGLDDSPTVAESGISAVFTAKENQAGQYGLSDRIKTLLKDEALKRAGERGSHVNVYKLGDDRSLITLTFASDHGLRMNDYLFGDAFIDAGEKIYITTSRDASGLWKIDDAKAAVDLPLPADGEKIRIERNGKVRMVSNVNPRNEVSDVSGHMYFGEYVDVVQDGVYSANAARWPGTIIWQVNTNSNKIEVASTDQHRSLIGMSPTGNGEYILYLRDENVHWENQKMWGITEENFGRHPMVTDTVVLGKDGNLTPLVNKTENGSLEQAKVGPGGLLYLARLAEDGNVKIMQASPESSNNETLLFEVKPTEAFRFGPESGLFFGQSAEGIPHVMFVGEYVGGGEEFAFDVSSVKLNPSNLLPIGASGREVNITPAQIHEAAQAAHKGPNERLTPYRWEPVGITENDDGRGMQIYLNNDILSMKPYYWRPLTLTPINIPNK